MKFISLDEAGKLIGKHANTVRYAINKRLTDKEKKQYVKKEGQGYKIAEDFVLEFFKVEKKPQESELIELLKTQLEQKDSQIAQLLEQLQNKDVQIEQYLQNMQIDRATLVWLRTLQLKQIDSPKE